MRKKITVPEAGKSSKIGLAGRSFVIENSPVYELPEHVPVIAFQPGENEYPVYPRNVYSQRGNYFNDLIITGTAESAGDEIEIFVTDECLETRFNVVLESQYKRKLKDSFVIESSNEAVFLTEIQMANSEGLFPVKMTVSCVGNDVKFAFGAEAEQGDGLGTVIRAGVDSYPIEGLEFIKEFNFISETLDSVADVTFHMEY